MDIVHCRNPIINIWYRSRAGKSAVLQAVNSIYGDPRLLEKTWNGTVVGIEQLLSFSANDSVLTLDEGGLIKGKVDEFIFMIASRKRKSKREKRRWH